MSDEESHEEEALPLEDLYMASDYSSFSENSSTGSIRSEAAKVEPEENLKVKLYKEGLYSPGSGEICAKYITMSKSSMLAHCYFAYPAVTDPGIEKALLFPQDEKDYPEDGQELYMDLCKEMKVIPVRIFHRGLKGNVIDLRYYGVNPKGVRAMCLALANNSTVMRLDLTSNFLEYPDACYHLGELLGHRNALKELILDGCRIGPDGLKQLVVHLVNHRMNILDLTGNNIQDDGLAHLSHKILKGAVITTLSLRKNDLSSDSLIPFAAALECNDSIQCLDISLNKLVKSKGQSVLLKKLGQSEKLEKLNLAWTGLSVTHELRHILSIKTLKVLDLSYNQLLSAAAKTIAKCLHIAVKLRTLDISGNKFTPLDAMRLLVRMKNEKVELTELRMDHISVSKIFAEELKALKKLPFRKNTIITHGYILYNYTVPPIDNKIFTMQRLVLYMTRGKCKLDVLSYFLENHKTMQFLETSVFVKTLKLYDSPLEDEFIEDFVKLFYGPKSRDGCKTINLNTIVDYIRRLWPDKKLPPTPPPSLPKTPPKKKVVIQDNNKKEKKVKNVRNTLKKKVL